MRQRLVLKFLFRLTAFCVVLFVLDRVIGYGFKMVYFNQKVGQFSQTTYAVDSASADVMIFGSSRAVRHYASPIISKELGLSCYNSGRDGQMIPYSAAVEEVSLNRHKPKLIILDINPWELANNPSKYEKLTILLPYCDEHKELVPYISEVSAFERYKLFLKVYPYNSSIFILATNALFPNTVKKDTAGYLPLEGVMTPAYLAEYTARMKARYERIKVKKEIPEEKGITYFKRFLDYAARYNIKTLVVISPTILKDPFELDNQSVEKKLVIGITKKYQNVTFLDYSSDARFNGQPQKFSDEFHLNRYGAEEFSTGFARYVKANRLME